MAKSTMFTAEVISDENGDTRVILRRQDGIMKTYNFPEKKLRLFKALDAPVKDAVDFLLGET